jgi:hypothetical protein
LVAALGGEDCLVQQHRQMFACFLSQSVTPGRLHEMVMQIDLSQAHDRVSASSSMRCEATVTAFGMHQSLLIQLQATASSLVVAVHVA